MNNRADHAEKTITGLAAGIVLLLAWAGLCLVPILLVKWLLL